MGRTILGTGVVAAALFAPGCARSLTGPTEVIGVTWRLQSLQRAEASVVSPPAGTFTLRFVADARLEVRADCNGCVGAFELEGAALAVRPLACTRAFCPSAPFDTDYVLLVAAATTVERTGDTLVLRSAPGTLRFTR